MAEDPACIFCKILAGEIPCHEIYRDDAVLAFLDIGPLSPGHTLVIPQAHVTTMDALSADQAAAIGGALPRLVEAVQAATGAAGLNVLQNNGAVAGQEVNHLHVHLIPRHDGDGLGFRWKPESYAANEAEAMRDRLRSALA